MDTVLCEVEYLELEGDYGPIASVRVHCSECGATSESYGQGDASIRRCLALLRESCLEGGSNFYVADD